VVILSFSFSTPRPPSSTLFPYTTLFRSLLFQFLGHLMLLLLFLPGHLYGGLLALAVLGLHKAQQLGDQGAFLLVQKIAFRGRVRSEEHTSELQSRENLVCRLLLEKKKKY